MESEYLCNLHLGCSQPLGLRKLMSKNVNVIVNNDSCVGCGICSLACPTKSIRMSWSSVRNSYVPLLNEETCQNCGLCLNVCPRKPHENKEVKRLSWAELLGSFNGLWLGYSTNKYVRYIAASGGVVTSLLLMALRRGIIDGAIVVKMQPGVVPTAKAFIATTPHEIVEAATSKYCPVVLSEVLESIDDTKRYAFVGLPCHIYALRKYSKVNSRLRKCIRLCLGLFCGGLPTYSGTIYVLKRLGVCGKVIKDIQFRGGGWPGRLLVKTDDGLVLKYPYPHYWNNAFLYFVPKGCLACLDVFNPYADIAVGDA